MSSKAGASRTMTMETDTPTVMTGGRFPALRILRACGIAGFLVGMLASCDPIAVLSLVGVSRDTSGRVVVTFVQCAGDHVRNVEVGAESADGTTNPVWRISTATATWPGRVAVGTAPLGFESVIPLRTALVPHGHYLAGVNRSGGGFEAGVSFVPADLSATTILDGHGHQLTPETFRSKASKFCASS
jgi:hypothetical protein